MIVHEHDHGAAPKGTRNENERHDKIKARSG
ncbi:hypothetical protein SMB34_04440 [Thalassospira permensis NBRC 106175]|uniref:Uncharacterized protein n=1 Tax=Thalassospira permensis NBRC 106175 TaxID=1353532 RepID=A0ABR4TLY9_9PROT|nr:hypothetical protein SMB34_04440 [Thalassospira permensis NBRC 106175]